MTLEQKAHLQQAIIDGLMAATAIIYELTVVTRNVRDFTVWQVPVINPWE